MDPKDETRLFALREEVTELLGAWSEMEITNRMTPDGMKFVATWIHFLASRNVTATYCMVASNTEEEALRSIICLEEAMIENDEDL